MACEIKDPTNNPICSDSLKDLKVNAIIMDQYINSQELSVPDRLGVDRKTWAGIEKDAQDNIDGFEDLINDKVLAAGGVEIADSFGNSKTKVINQDFITENTARFESFPSVLGGYEQFEGEHSLTICGINKIEPLVSRDMNNIYIGGKAKLDGNSVFPLVMDSALTNQARFNIIGGQLSSLKRDLSQPLIQKMGVVFIGDSLTWGSGTGESAPSEPRNGRMSDPRDNFAANSFVNVFKKYIGARYFSNGTFTLSNNSHSSSGQSIITYKETKDLFFYEDLGIKYDAGGGVTPLLITKYTDSKLGFRAQINSQKGNNPSLTFKITGDSFSLVYAKFLEGGVISVFLNSEKISDINTSSSSGYQSGTVANINFDYVKDGVVTLVFNSTIEVDQAYYLECISVNREISIKNNGINGSYTTIFLNYNKDTAFEYDDKYCFLQLGANDRGNTNVPTGGSGFIKEMNDIIDILESKEITPVLMATPNAINRTDQHFSISDVSKFINQIGKSRSIDIIDNYSVTLNTDPRKITNDGLHLNVEGSAIVARNIITALESSGN